MLLMKQLFPTTVSKLICGLVLCISASLWYQYFMGEGGYFAHQALLKNIAAQKIKNTALTDSNRVLAAEVYDLKNGIEAIEEHARLDLGLIKPRETFVQMSTVNTNYQSIYSSTQSSGAIVEDELRLNAANAGLSRAPASAASVTP